MRALEVGLPREGRRKPREDTEAGDGLKKKWGEEEGERDRQTERLKWLSKHIVLKNGDT